jgi:8-oxo-dGTP pyrophosphatase MutT (NUDIX family)
MAAKRVVRLHSTGARVRRGRMYERGEQTTGVRVDDLTRYLARDFMRLEVGDRLPTVRALAAEHGASLASVQTALARLEADGAIAITRRGRLGAFLESGSLPGLWASSDGPPLIMTLPLPTNLRGQGLATAVKLSLEEAGLDTFLTFVRGSRNRLRALKEGRCHIVVMSGLAATIAADPGLVSVSLPVQTFAEERRVFEHRPGPDEEPIGRRPLRVVIDSESSDLQRLTELEFEGRDVELVEAVYMQSIALIESGKADAAVWDLDETTRRLPPHVTSRPLSPHVREIIGDTETRVSFVTRADDPPSQIIVERCLDPERIVEVQQKVLAGEMVPGY